MFFGPLLLLFRDPLAFLVEVVSLLFGMVLHNMVQAALADWLGDGSARRSGFLRTDPQTHFDLFSLLWYFLIGFLLPRSIPLNARSLRGRERSAAWVWLSGVLTLLVWALVLLLLAQLIATGLPGLAAVVVGLSGGASQAVIQAVIFLVPLPMLDGGKALYAVGSFSVRRALDQLSQAGPWVILILFLLLSLTGVLQLISTAILGGIYHLIGGLAL